MSFPQSERLAPCSNGSSGLRLRSAVPGRVRWDVQALLRAPRRASAVECALHDVPGVRHATANPVTGRVLVEFAPHTTDAGALE